MGRDRRSAHARRSPQALTGAYFDTLRVQGADPAVVRKAAETAGINFLYVQNAIGISLDETTSIDDVQEIVRVVTGGRGREVRPGCTSPLMKPNST